MKRQEFYEFLRKKVVGQKIAGKSGYVKLQEAKESYFDKVILPELQKFVDEILAQNPEIEDEVFDLLRDFFDGCYSDGGILQQHPALPIVVELNEDNPKLVWPTQDFYFVKTDRLFQNMLIETKNYKFYFDASNLVHKKADEKKEIGVKFKHIENDGTIVLEVSYYFKFGNSDFEEVAKILQQNGINIDRKTLKRIVNSYIRKCKSETYYICKEPREFLTKQFNLWFFEKLLKSSQIK